MDTLADLELLKTFAARILEHGPNLVLVNSDQPLPPAEARARFGVEPCVIYVKRSGWSLGARFGLEREARAMYAEGPDHWLGVIRGGQVFLYHPEDLAHGVERLAVLHPERFAEGGVFKNPTLSGVEYPGREITVKLGFDCRKFQRVLGENLPDIMRFHGAP